MALSNIRYVAPNNVLKSVVDDNGNGMYIGEQKDAIEFSTVFQSRLIEGLGESNNSTMNETLKDKYQSLFFGKYDTIVYGNKKRNYHDTSLGIIMLNPEDNFYSSWVQSYFKQFIENCIENEKVTSTYQDFYITKFPKVMFFQIKRVDYNKEKKITEKNKLPVQIEKEIYVDIFDKANIDLSKKVIEQYYTLQKKISETELIYKKWDKSNPTDVLPEETITNMINLLQKQVSPDPNIPLDKFSPECITSNSIVNSETNKDIIMVLDHLKQKAIQNKQELTITLKQLKEERTSLFTKGMKNKYYLHSIVMHWGIPSFGHYFVYTYDFSSKKWWKCSDVQIIEEKEEVVLKNAQFGGPEGSTSYFLVYISSSEFSLLNSTKPIWKCCTDDKDCSTLDSLYKLWVPYELREPIINENESVKREVESKMISQIAEFKRVFNKKSAEIQRILTNPKLQYSRYMTSYFSFLFKDWITIPKWYLFKEVVANVFKIDLQKINTSGILYTKLEEVRKGDLKIYPNSLTLSTMDANALLNMSYQFKQYLTLKLYMLYAYRKMYEFKYKEILNTLEGISVHDYPEEELLEFNYLRELLVYALYVEAKKCLLNKDYEEFSMDISIILSSVTMTFSINSIQYKFIKTRLESCVSTNIGDPLLNKPFNAIKEMGKLQASNNLKQQLAHDIPQELKKFLALLESAQLYAWKDNSEKDPLIGSYESDREQALQILSIYDKWRSKLKDGKLTDEEVNEDELTLMK